MAQVATSTTTPNRVQAREEVQEFLDRFARALTAGDGRGVAALWEAPAFVLGDEAMPVASREEVERFFSGARSEYNARGVTDTRAEIVDLRWPNDRIALVEVRWPWLDAAGREKGSESSTYTLHRDAQGELKLRVAVMHGATAG